MISAQKERRKNEKEVTNHCTSEEAEARQHVQSDQRDLRPLVLRKIEDRSKEETSHKVALIPN